MVIVKRDNFLVHHGIRGQKWGRRRYQNPDGTLTDAGRRRYGYDGDGDRSSGNAGSIGSAKIHALPPGGGSTKTFALPPGVGGMKVLALPPAKDNSYILNNYADELKTNVSDIPETRSYASGGSSDYSVASDRKMFKLRQKMVAEAAKANNSDGGNNNSNNNSNGGNNNSNNNSGKKQQSEQQTKEEIEKAMATKRAMKDAGIKSSIALGSTLAGSASKSYEKKALKEKTALIDSELASMDDATLDRAVKRLNKEKAYTELRINKISSVYDSRASNAKKVEGFIGGIEKVYKVGSKLILR